MKKTFVLSGILWLGCFMMLLLPQCKKEDTNSKLAVYAKFIITPETGTVGTSFTFDSSSTTWDGYEPGVPFRFSYTWDFGDETVKTNANNIETHQYQAPGRYTVVLTITLENLSTGEKAEDTFSAELDVS